MVGVAVDAVMVLVTWCASGDVDGVDVGDGLGAADGGGGEKTVESTFWDS